MSEAANHWGNPTRRFLAVLLGWIGAGLVNSVTWVAMGPAFGASRAEHATAHFIEFGRHLGAGLVMGALVFAYCRFVGKARLLSLCIVSLLAGLLVIFPDAEGFAARLGHSTGLSPDLLHLPAVAAASQVIPAAWWGTRWLTTKRLGSTAAIVGALSVYALNTSLWDQDNMGLHFFMSWSTATIFGAVVLRFLEAREIEQRISPRPIAAASLALAVWAFAALSWPASSNLTIALNQWSPNLLLLSWRSSVPLGKLLAPDLQEQERAFYQDRSSLEPVLPTRPPIVKQAPVVIVLTVDALRYDILTNPRHSRFIPNIKRLAGSGVSFTQARAPGSQTVSTLSSFSTGKYFSQLHWSKFKNEYWLQEDDSTHLATLLQEAGITTVAVPTARWFVEEYGILRGFEENEYRKTRHSWTHAKSVTPRIRTAISEHHEQALFLFAHFLDPHAPYDRGKLGKTRGSQFQRYLSELELVDAQIGAVVEEIDRLEAWDRTLLIVSADHGEAFGEHGVKHRHGVNLFEELIHVPLIAYGAGLPVRRVEEPVSLVDLGPTILDIFQLPTPPQFMGQSLVPLLQGKDVRLVRPIVAEGRLKRAMIFRDGTKVIWDSRKQVVELYDLNKDPKELKNLSDHVDLETNNAYRKLREFFDVHTLKRPGYEPPYRK